MSSTRSCLRTGPTAVRDFLVAQGVQMDNIAATGYGQSESGGGQWHGCGTRSEPASAAGGLG